MRTNLQTGPQTTFAITPAITYTTGLQQTVRLSLQIGPQLASRVDRQVPVDLAS